MFEQVKSCIDRAQTICILSHKSPDGDTIACNVALQKCLRNLGKHVVGYCSDPIPEVYTFLIEETVFIHEWNQLPVADLYIAVDIADPKLLGIPTQNDISNLFQSMIVIDHHPDNTFVCDIKIIDPTASSTTIILYELFRYMGISISRSIANDLLVGIYSDTGGFMHANTTDSAYRVASKLMLLGANANNIAKRLFRYFPLNRLRLWGEVFKRVNINKNNVVSSLVRKEDYAKTETTSEDLQGVVEYLNMVPGSTYSLLLTEDENQPQIKGSLRTLNDNVDVSEIAHKFGGGGHKKASGFRISGKIEEEVRWKIVDDQNSDVVEDIRTM